MTLLLDNRMQETFMFVEHRNFYSIRMKLLQNSVSCCNATGHDIVSTIGLLNDLVYCSIFLAIQGFNPPKRLAVVSPPEEQPVSKQQLTERVSCIVCTFWSAVYFLRIAHCFEYHQFMKGVTNSPIHEWHHSVNIWKVVLSPIVYVYTSGRVNKPDKV